MKQNPPAPTSQARTKNIVISGTSFWNPGDDFVRDGVLRVLREAFPGETLNFLFYNFNEDFFPQSKFRGIGNFLTRGDLENCRDYIDAVVIAGLSAGNEIKDLYRWVIANGLQDRVYLLGAGYENDYVAQHSQHEPEATIFKQARLVTGRTARRPAFMSRPGFPYVHLNCPAILCVPEVKQVAAGKKIKRVGFSIQLPHGAGVPNHTCAPEQYQLAAEILCRLYSQCEVEVIAHHKSEYFHFLRLFRGKPVSVIFSSFYQDLHEIYRRCDLVVTTRLHSSLFANGHGIPGIIVNDTDRHTHTLQGFPHSTWINNHEGFQTALKAVCERDLAGITREAEAFKRDLLAKYVAAFRGAFHSPPRNSGEYSFDSEKKEQALVRSLVKPGMVAFDVGANIGKYTKLFSLLVGGGGKVFAFEADPRSAQRVRKLVAEDRLANVNVVNQAVAECADTVTLNQFPDEYCSWNSLGRPRMEDPRNRGQFVPIVSSVDVESVALDEFCRAHRIESIDYLKLDVEGAEFRALQGAQNLLRRQAIRFLQFEVSKKMLEGLNTCARPVFELLNSHGYDCHAISETGEILGVVGDSQEFYENYIALPNPARLRNDQFPTARAQAGSAEALPVHFFTIVLNGQPFIRHHIEAFKQLPFAWHWHVIEGVADLNHDTGWSKAGGGNIPAELHRNGLSVDGTTEYLDALKAAFPNNITIYRAPAGQFWDGKRAMVNAPLANIAGEALLWQLDADELWTASQIVRTRSLFLAHPEKSAALFYCHYFVGANLVTTTRDTYGNYAHEWMRVWRYQPGDRWLAHEPPRLCRGETDVASLNPFRHAETEAHGLVFQHYAYATEAQVQFKESYYGYAGAVEQWRNLQHAKNFPLRLADYLAWVKDEALVNTTDAMALQPLAPGNWFAGTTEHRASANPMAGPRRILFVRTDSIGDAVLASSMLEPVRRKYPQATLAVLCQHHVADLYAACPFIDAVVCFDIKRIFEPAERQQIVDEIAAFNPDLVLNSIRSRDKLAEELTFAFPHARHVAIAGDQDNITGAERAAADARYDQIIPTPDGHQSELQRHVDFLNGLDIEAGQLQPVVWTSPEDEALADAFFQQQQLKPARTIAVFPGAQYQMRVYNRYADALKNLTGYRFLVFGDATQNHLAEELERALPGRTINLCGRSTLRETAALLRRCRLYVGAESAGAHIACAVGVPNVVLLGGGHFGRFMPYSPLTSAVVLPMDCFGCNWRCKHDTAHCVASVEPRVIEAAIQSALKGPRQKPAIFALTNSAAAALPAVLTAKIAPESVEFVPVPVPIVESPWQAGPDTSWGRPGAAEPRFSPCETASV